MKRLLPALCALALSASPVSGAAPDRFEALSGSPARFLEAARLLEVKGQAPAGSVSTGLDRLEETGFAELRGLRVGLITNHTGRDRAGRGTVEVLASAAGVTLAAVFTPEHGFDGGSDDVVRDGGHLVVGGRRIPLISLYRSYSLSGMRPRPEDLRGLDALVFDIQDSGARFYTYLGTMALALEEAARAGLPFYVLDRPNPLGGQVVEGPILEDQVPRDITAYFPVPVRHGMTAGEMALLHNSVVRHKGLRVIEMRGWTRERWYDQTGLPWIGLSPNMPDLAAATLYPGIGCLEVGNVSVGRGTPAPFRWVGAPWLDAQAVVDRLKASRLEGVDFSVQAYTPSRDIHAGKRSPGVLLSVTDRSRLRPLTVFAHLAAALRDVHGKKFHLDPKGTLSMVGTPRFLERLSAGASAAELSALFDEGPTRFETERARFLLY